MEIEPDNEKIAMTVRTGRKITLGILMPVLVIALYFLIIPWPVVILETKTEIFDDSDTLAYKTAVVLFTPCNWVYERFSIYEDYVEWMITVFDS